MSKYVLAMSGGVDSSVCAELLTKEGHSVVGVFMRHGIASIDNDGRVARRKHGCCSDEDAMDAQKVADRLGIPLHIIDFHQEFCEIIEYFVAEYTACRTPNPCIVCNDRLKFGKLFDFAQEMGADFVATGHYARLDFDENLGEYVLRRGVDATKDQSYVLHRIAPERLPFLRFPLGGYRKEEIRKMALEANLHNAEKKDSQEICFIPNDNHAEFVANYVCEKTGAPPNTLGNFVTSDGRIIAPHAGLEGYTVGQRKGLGLAFKEPHYVLRLNPETNEVVLGTHDELARWELSVASANWLTRVPEEFECDVKIRYRTAAAPAKVQRFEGDRFVVQFSCPMYGLAPGQAAVCYDGDRVLGGGWIES
ncbi:MAG: tRNA 2-thiouridine(34) synthase MnmA [Planctomycetia bacterium]|nr:tRNA 2-thiouridine(34) synthase MnmA [Planctomycetia bacterium]